MPEVPCPRCYSVEHVSFQDESIPVVKKDGTTQYCDVLYCDRCAAEFAAEPRRKP